MPATEQTWRDQRTLHKWFAGTCVVLLISTIWMFLADHNREWKRYQRTFRDIEIQNNSWAQRQFQTEEFLRQHDELNSRLLALQSQALAPALMADFRNEVHADAKNRGLDEYDFSDIQEAEQELAGLAEEAKQARDHAEQLRASAAETRVMAADNQVAAKDAKQKIAAAKPEEREAAQKFADDLAAAAAALVARADSLDDESEQADEAAFGAEEKSGEARVALLARLRTIIAAAKFREDQALDKRKELSGIYDAEKAELGLAVRDHRPQAVLDDLQTVVFNRKKEVDEASLAYEQTSDHRKELERIVGEMMAAEDAAQKELEDTRANLERLKTANIERRSTYFVGSFPFLGKAWLEMPILDAFNSPLQIDNLWDEDNRIDFNFSRVRRYDRCTTCHQAMQKTKPGSAVDPAYVGEEFLDFVVSTPDAASYEKAKDRLKELLAKWEERKKEKGEGNAGTKPTLEEVVYGLHIAPEGEYLLNRSDVTVSFVRPYSRFGEDDDTSKRPSSRAAEAKLLLLEGSHDPIAAEELVKLAIQYNGDRLVKSPDTEQGLMTGDVIVAIDGEPISSRDQAKQVLLGAEWGQPLLVRVRRGLPNPYTAHPRLDLFVGSLSPHKMSVFGCTICHEGQGSATAFKYASHAPDSVKQMNDWDDEHGWFDNHHWIYPMFPKRHAEGSCLKCHFDVEALEPSKKFPDPPAPKLTRGYNVINKFGCYGCHEINGFDGPDRVGPDIRLEPNYFAAAQQLLSELPAREEQLENERQRIEASLADVRAEVERILAAKSQLADKMEVEAEEYKAALRAEEDVSELEKKRLQRIGERLGLDNDLAKLVADPEAILELDNQRLAQIQQLETAKASLAADQQKLDDPGDETVEAIQARIQLSEATITGLEASISDLRQQMLVAIDNSGELPVIREDIATLEKMRGLAETIAFHPDDMQALHELYQTMDEDAQRNGDLGYGSVLDKRSRKLLPMFKKVGSPGTRRKAGPALRFVASKLDDQFLYDWLQDPTNFRKNTRMPRFFGLWGHLDSSGAAHKKQDLLAEQRRLEEAESPDPEKLKEIGEQIKQVNLDLSKHQEARFEQIEILGITRYLLAKSQPFEYVEKRSGIVDSTREDMLKRGKDLFQTQGCLACHSHDQFPDAENYREKDAIVQGPDLSDLAAKFSEKRNPNGPRWLYSWLRQPNRYHVRTVMPQLFLDPVPVKDAESNVIGHTDPAEDIVEYLLDESRAKWKPREVMPVRLNADKVAFDPQTARVLEELAKINLKDAFSDAATNNYLAKGIPADMGAELKGAEIEMVLRQADIDAIAAEVAKFEKSEQATKKADLTAELLSEKKLLYVGRKALTKYGCYACHDIPGFEDAKPIGTGLADWGRKEPSKLAFEHILEYLDGHGHGSHGDDGDHTFTEDDREFYHHALEGGHRAGFIYQKLREPRSYDYHKTENIKYNERLRMPQFSLTDAEREAIITFVLGLVADPPAPKFVYHPPEHEKTLLEGRHVLNKYNCGGCHVLETEKWDIAYRPGDFRIPDPPTDDFPFIRPHFSALQIEESKNADRRGLMHARLTGLPTTSGKTTGGEVAGMARIVLPNPEENGEFALRDWEDETKPAFYDPTILEYSLDLWKPALLNGGVWQVDATPGIQADMIDKRYPADGGMLAKYLVPEVIRMALEQKSASGAQGNQAWGWVPPPLVGEGNKVQTAWLHDFLLDPYRIRPAVVLRMPKFNMSPEEATKLANYFAAVDGADHPYEFGESRSESYLQQREAEFRTALQELTMPPEDVPKTRYEAALNIIADKKNNGCASCHFLGDHDPGGDPFASGPDLTKIYQRLRPDFVRKWVANPARTLPYTGMPAVIKYAAKPEDFPKQEHFPGTRRQQLDGVVDFLMNFDRFAASKLSMKAIVLEKEAKANAAAEADGEAAKDDGEASPSDESESNP